MGGLAAADAALRAEVALASAAAGGSDGRSDGGSVGCSAGGAVTAVPSAAVTTEDEHGEGGGTESVDISGSAPAAATLTPTDTRYALSGVVVHSGMANGGHYYSYIRVRDAPGHEGPNHGKWWVPTLFVAVLFFYTMDFFRPCLPLCPRKFTNISKRI